MSLTPVRFDGFGAGLNLTAKADAVGPGECIDAMNVTLSEREAIQQRDGYAAFTSPALTNRTASLEPYYRTGAANQLIAGCGTRLEAINAGGGVVASATGLTDAVWDFARFGAPGSEYVYAGNGTNTIRRWDGSSWTAPANMPAGGALAVQAVDQGNRLVVGKFDTTTGGPTGGAGTSNPSRVHFSDAGAPETWGTNNYVDLTPGDGEKVQAIIAWRDGLFVFKSTKFFRFYGTGEDADGNPVFNYQTIDSGVGLASPRAVCADRHGVYFMARDGIYMTDGGAPEQVSDNLDPIWTGQTSSYYLGGVLAHSAITNCAMTCHAERVYLAFPTSSANDRIIVHDPRYGWFSLFDIPAAAMTSFRIGDQAELVFAYSSGSNHIGRYSPSYTNDAGAAITSRWRSGWSDLGYPEQKVSRQQELWGSGKVLVGVSTDFSQGAGDLIEVDFGTATDTWGSGSGPDTWGSGSGPDTWGPESGQAWRLRRHADRGTLFSVTFQQNTLDQPWAVHRLQHDMRIPRATGVGAPG